MIQNKSKTLTDVLRKEYLKDELKTIFWKGLVIDTDTNGNSSWNITKIKGSLKCRIMGLHNYISSKNEKEDRDRLPIVFPFFGQSGSINQLPQKGEWVWIVFETLEPVGQSYWLSLCVDKPKETSNSLKELYKKLFGE